MSLIFLASFSFVQLSLLLVQESTVYKEFFLFEKRFGLFFLKNNYTVSNKGINIGSIKSCSNAGSGGICLSWTLCIKTVFSPMLRKNYSCKMSQHPVTSHNVSGPTHYIFFLVCGTVYSVFLLSKSALPRQSWSRSCLYWVVLGMRGAWVKNSKCKYIIIIFSSLFKNCHILYAFTFMK